MRHCACATSRTRLRTRSRALVSSGHQWGCYWRRWDKNRRLDPRGLGSVPKGVENAIPTPARTQSPFPALKIGACHPVQKIRQLQPFPQVPNWDIPSYTSPPPILGNQSLPSPELGPRDTSGPKLRVGDQSIHSQPQTLGPHPQPQSGARLSSMFSPKAGVWDQGILRS